MPREGGGIQYSAAFAGAETPAFTGSSAFADDDSEFLAPPEWRAS